MSIDPTDPLEAARRANRVLAERVADLERQLKRFSGSSSTGTQLGDSLEEREALLSEAERIAHMGSWVWNVATNEVRWSPELYRILGYDPATDAASYERFFARIHPDDVAHVRESSARSVASGISERVEFRVLRPGGDVRYVMIDAVLLFDGSGRLQRSIGAALDVTEMRQAARELARTASLLAEAQRIGKMGSFDVDLIENRVSWSEQLYKLIDVDPSEPASLELFVRRLHEDDREHVQHLIERSQSLGETRPSRARVVWRDGSLHHLDMMGAVAREPDGRIRAVRGTVTDVTELVKLEAQFHRSQKMEAIGQLAGGLAHDYNNLMMVISGNAELIVQRADCPEAREILQAASIAAGVTRRLLAFSSQVSQRAEVVRLSSIIEASQALLVRALGSNVDLIVDIAAEIWPVFVDSGQIQQILLNVALNARDAMPEGGTFRLSASNEELTPSQAQQHGEEPGEYVALRASDSGIGMDEGTRLRAFEPFFTTKPSGQGTGLGLAMVFGCMKQCGGFVELQSQLGAGTTVTLWFPRSKHEAMPEHKPAPTAKGGSASVLLVEDNLQVAKLTRRMLESAGYHVRTAHHPEEALRLWRSGPSDVLVTDVEMPGMSGVRLSEQIRALTPLLRTLYITGHSNQRIDLQAHPGRCALLIKPFRHNDLLLALASLLAR